MKTLQVILVAALCLLTGCAFSSTRYMVAKGSIAADKNRYPIILDTGASQAVFVKDVHVVENNLPIHPPQNDQQNPAAHGAGRCFVPQLKIGDVTLENLPCWYLRQQVKLEFLGLPIARDDSIIVGLPALRHFKYILLDSRCGQVEFSHKQAFEPDQPHLWSQYPLSIEEDCYGNAYAFVQIPIAGEPMKVQLDTGSPGGLAIGEETWQMLSGRVQNDSLKKGTDLYPYIGALPCKRTVIKELEVGDRLVRKAKISVFPSDSPLLSQSKAILGTQYFQDTIMVLDFHQHIMWVKNPQKS